MREEQLVQPAFRNVDTGSCFPCWDWGQHQQFSAMSFLHIQVRQTNCFLSIFVNSSELSQFFYNFSHSVWDFHNSSHYLPLYVFKVFQTLLVKTWFISLVLLPLTVTAIGWIFKIGKWHFWNGKKKWHKTLFFLTQAWSIGHSSDCLLFSTLI